MEILKNREEKFTYLGQLSEYQVKAEKKTIVYDRDSYTPYQTHLYKRALYGLSAFTEQELATMCSKKKQRVSNVYVKGQKIINLYKQKLSIAYSNMVFKRFFPDSPLTSYFLNNQETDINHINTLTFKDLNISKEDIINVFIEEGVLPKNFHSITIDPNFLPKLRNSGS